MKAFWFILIVGSMVLMAPYETAAKGGAAGGEGGAPPPAAWTEITSVQEVIAHAPDRVAALLEALDLEQPGLGRVKAAAEAGDRAAACEALLAYYREGDSAPWLRGRPASGELGEGALEQAEDILEDIYRGFGDRGQVPRGADGHLDWSHRGPNNDRQFANKVNRHGHLHILLRAYKATGEAKYIERLDRDLRDWLLAAGGEPAPEGFGHGPLEASFRMATWPRIFYALQGERRFLPATRLMMLMAMPAHAAYLQETLRRHHNFATMQMDGLGTIGLAFPEFREAGRWWRFAREVMAEEASGQFYPDGAQIELTFGYHNVALGRFTSLRETAQAAGASMGEDFAEHLEGMYDYVARVLRPDGRGPMNGDSESGYRTERLLRAAEDFGRPDWRYIATGGAEGERPEGPPSRFLPWAGQLVSRSGWDPGAHWSFFDIGPYGHGGHGHPDKLHLSVMAHGRRLLVDTGRFAYQGRIAEKFRRPYMWHTRSHNAMLIDGRSQAEGEKVAKQPIGDTHVAIGADHDWALGAMSAWRDLEGEATHRRAVYYRRGEYWLVVDQVETDRPRTIEPLWHFHPDCTVAMDGEAVHTSDPGAGNLRIAPAPAPAGDGDAAWNVRLARGEEKPELMGWYSPTMNHVEPTTVAIYEAQIEAGVTSFAWLLVPAGGEVPPAEAKLLAASEDRVTVRVAIGDGPAEVVDVAVRPQGP